MTAPRQRDRQAFYDFRFSAGELLAAGCIMAAAFLFNPSTASRMVQFLLFLLLSWGAGKRNRPLIMFSVMAGIILFNLLIPYGKVLYQLGPLKITQGSLISGIHRAITLEGLIVLSRLMVRRDLRLPGDFGALIGESLAMFEELTERKQSIKGNDIIGGIDDLMVSLSDTQARRDAEAISETKPALSPSGGGSASLAPDGEPPKASWPGRAILLGAVSAAWIIRFLSFPF